jgi:hypothetical protein
VIVNSDVVTTLKVTPVYCGAIASLDPDMGFATLSVDGHPQMIVRVPLMLPETFPHFGGPFKIGARFRFYITEPVPHTRPPGIWAQQLAPEASLDGVVGA